MSTFVSGSAPKLFAPGLRKVICDNLSQWDKLYQKYLSVDTSNRQYEKDYSMFGIYQMGSVPENANYPEGQVTTGYEKTYTHAQYGLMLKYGLVAKEDELYGFLKKLPGFLTKAMTHTVETLACAVINDAATTTGVDGVYLASLSHPALDSTHANIPASYSDLCYTTLEAARTTFIRKRKSFEGHPVLDTEKKILMIPPDLEPMAMKILQTDKMPFSADNTVNIMNSSFELVVNPYMTDTNMWVILNKPNDDGGKFWWRIKPSIKEYTDNSNDATAIRMRFRLSCGVSDWRKFLLYFNSGA
jgi:hypothetical protein